MLDTERLRKTIDHVGALLVRREYDALESLTNGERLSAEELRRAVEDYGEQLAHPPDRTYELRSVVDIEGSEPESCSVYVDLWTAQGQSDLTLEATVRDGGSERYSVEIDDLHVL